MIIYAKFLFPVVLAAAGLLTACGTAEKNYTEDELLERPPTLDAVPASQQETFVRSEIPKKQEKGLGEDVSINSDSPLQIRVARPFDIAWHDVEMALKTLEIEMTDREHDKGQYYVTSDADDYQPEDSGLLAKSTSFFKNDYKPVVYILTVLADGSTETTVSAAIASEAEQTTHGLLADKDNNLTDGADKLLLSLYRTLRNDLVED